MSAQMLCPKCAERDNKVTQTREHQSYNWIRRRRVCNHCDYRWNTLELLEDELQTEEA
jgi:transcriptional repressor NrdR